MTRQRDDSPQPSLEQMGRLVVPVLPPEREARLQARAAASVERALERVLEKRSIWRGRVSGALVASAAIAVMALGAGWLLSSRLTSRVAAPHVLASSEGVAIIRASGARVPASGGLALAQGDELATAAGTHANLLLADRAAVEVASETRLRVGEPPSGNAKNERIELVQGEVSLEVPKLDPGSTLSVRTPDALVTVHGTRFTVSVQRDASTSVVTRVSVSDGRVEVESLGRTRFLTRGEHWSSAPETQAEKGAIVATEPRESTAADEAPRRAAPAPQRAIESDPTGSTVETHPSPPKARRAPEPTSTLADENGMYQSALRSARNGEPARSLATLEGLMQQYPRSPLLQSARVEHFRVLLQMGSIAAAAREARRYLSEYPSGFARAEAREIALRGLGDAD